MAYFGRAARGDWMRAVCIAAMTVLLGGCAVISDSVQEYSFVKVEYVTMPDDTYRVFDKPEAGKMLVSSSIASATSQSLRAAVLLKDNTPPRSNFEAAAGEYLSNGGRTGCRIVDAYLLIAPQYEVKYDCAPLPPPAPAKRKPARSRANSG
jgi:hypothetical protein